MKGGARLLPAALLAVVLACALPPGALAGAPPDEGHIDVRTEDKVYLIDSADPLVGEIESETATSLRIRLRGTRITRTVSMSNVRRILRRQTAEQAFQKLLAARSAAKDAVALRRLALEALKLEPVKMVDNAVKALEAARTLKPGYGPARLLLGQLYLRKEDTRKAAEEARKVIEIMPENPSGHVLLGTALGRRGKPKEAAAALEKALGLKPSAQDRICAARTLSEIGRLDQAEKVIKKVLDETPASAPAKLAAGLVYLRKADLVQAESMLSAAAEKLKDQSEPHLALAALYYLKGDLDAAGREINEALNYGGRARAYALKGLLELRGGKADRAAGNLDTAMRLEPNIGRVAAAKAVLELSGDRLDGALTALEGPLGKAGCRDAYVHYLQGHLLHRKGEFPKALAAFTKAAELLDEEPKGPGKPRWIDVYLAAGAAALAARNYPAAARSFGEAVKVDEKSAVAHAGLGLAYLGQVGREQEADKELRRALAIEGKCLDAHLGLGFLANRQKREMEAIKYFERAVALDGSSKYAVAALAKLRAGRGEDVRMFSFDGPGLPTGWKPDQRYGVLAKAEDGRVLLTGVQKRVGGRDTRFYVHQDSRKFRRLEMDVEARTNGTLVAGMFLAGPRGLIELAMFETGKLSWRCRDRSGWRAPADLMDWPKGAGGAAGRLRLGIEAVDPDRGLFRLYVQGRAVTNVLVDTLARAQGYQVGAFCRAPEGEGVLVGLDNATLVTRRQQKLKGKK